MTYRGAILFDLDGTLVDTSADFCCRHQQHAC
jgi:beta-phosphoglucomutase-like phosphatase (HAD superfamily)